MALVSAHNIGRTRFEHIHGIVDHKPIMNVIVYEDRYSVDEIGAKSKWVQGDLEVMSSRGASAEMPLTLRSPRLGATLPLRQH